MRFTIAFEVITLILVCILLGFILGLWVNLINYRDNEQFYIERCLYNNVVTKGNLTQLNQCKHSFEIFKNKR